jgi:hypothetical protein
VSASVLHILRLIENVSDPEVLHRREGDIINKEKLKSRLILGVGWTQHNNRNPIIISIIYSRNRSRT